MLHEEVVYKRGKGSYEDAIAEGEKLIAEGYEPMREFRMEWDEETGEWAVYFRVRREIMERFRDRGKVASRKAMSVDPRPHGRNYKRRFDWITRRDYNRDEQETPFWDREQQPEESAGGYDMTNRFQDSDKAMPGPIARLSPRDTGVRVGPESRHIRNREE